MFYSSLPQVGSLRRARSCEGRICVCAAVAISRKNADMPQGSTCGCAAVANACKNAGVPQGLTCGCAADASHVAASILFPILILRACLRVFLGKILLKKTRKTPVRRLDGVTWVIYISHYIHVQMRFRHVLAMKYCKAHQLPDIENVRISRKCDSFSKARREMLTSRKCERSQ